MAFQDWGREQEGGTWGLTCQMDLSLRLRVGPLGCAGSQCCRQAGPTIPPAACATGDGDCTPIPARRSGPLPYRRQQDPGRLLLCPWLSTGAVRPGALEATAFCPVMGHGTAPGEGHAAGAQLTGRPEGPGPSPAELWPQACCAVGPPGGGQRPLLAPVPFLAAPGQPSAGLPHGPSDF